MCMCWYIHCHKSVWLLAWWCISSWGPCLARHPHYKSCTVEQKAPVPGLHKQRKACSEHPMRTLVDRGAGGLCDLWAVWMGPRDVRCCALMLPKCSHYHPDCSCYCSWGELEWNPWTRRKNCSISVAMRVHFCCPYPSACSWKRNQSQVQIRMTLITNILSEGFAGPCS